MAKKLKITEDQLKRLMVLKENLEFDDFDSNIQPEELPNVGLENLTMGQDEDSNNELDRMVDSFIRQYNEKASQGVDEYMIDSLCDKIRQGLGGEESQSNYKLPGDQETMNNLNNLSIREYNNTVNESVIKIKSEFKRFL